MLQTTKLFVLALALAGSALLNPAKAQMPNKQLELEAAQAAAARAAATKGQTGDTSREKPANQQAPQTVKKAVQKPSQEQNPKAPKAGSNIFLPSPSAGNPANQQAPQTVKKAVQKPSQEQNPKAPKADSNIFLRSPSAQQPQSNPLPNMVGPKGVALPVKNTNIASLPVALQEAQRARAECWSIMLETGYWQNYAENLSAFNSGNAIQIDREGRVHSTGAPVLISCAELLQLNYSQVRSPVIESSIETRDMDVSPRQGNYVGVGDDLILKRTERTGIITVTVNLLDLLNELPGEGYSENGNLSVRQAHKWVDDHIILKIYKNCGTTAETRNLSRPGQVVQIEVSVDETAPDSVCFEALRVGGTEALGNLSESTLNSLNLRATRRHDLRSLKLQPPVKRDLVAIAFGDSYGSGEGNPATTLAQTPGTISNIMANQVWYREDEDLDNTDASIDRFVLNSTNYCHRSSKSAFSQLHKVLVSQAPNIELSAENVKFASFACTGAISPNIFKAHHKQVDVLQRSFRNAADNIELWRQIVWPNLPESERLWDKHKLDDPDFNFNEDDPNRETGFPFVLMKDICVGVLTSGSDRGGGYTVSNCSAMLFSVPPQLSQAHAWLNRNNLSKEDVDLVTVSIGGNDARFGWFIAECIIKYGDCYDNDDREYVNEANAAYERARRAVGQTFQHLKNEFPNAKFIFTDYAQAMSKPSTPGDRSLCRPDNVTEYPDDPNWDVAWGDIQLLDTVNSNVSRGVSAGVGDHRNDRPGGIFSTNVWGSTLGKGFCAGSNDRIIRFNDEAVLIQGPDQTAFGVSTPYSSGGWHPNENGYLAALNELKRVIRQNSLLNRVVYPRDIWNVYLGL